VGPRAGLDRCRKSIPSGIRSLDRSARSQFLYRLSYPAHSVTLLPIIVTMKAVELYNLIYNTTVNPKLQRNCVSPLNREQHCLNYCLLHMYIEGSSAALLHVESVKQQFCAIVCSLKKGQ
jgi:hypothetical protein